MQIFIYKYYIARNNPEILPKIRYYVRHSILQIAQFRHS